MFFIRRGGETEGPTRGGPRRVVLARAEAQPVSRVIEAVANVEAAESVIVTAEAAGRIAAVNFRDGQRVSKGQVLFRMESDQQSADVDASRATVAELRQRLERLQRLADEGAIARGQLDDVRRQVQAAEARTESLQTVLSDTAIRAPFSGIVGLREVSPGALVQPGDELVSLDDARSVKLRFTLPEQQIARVRPGAPVEASSPAFPERVFKGEVTSFDSRLGTGQRTLELQARLPNQSGEWRAGMLADIRITAETVDEAVTVPPMAVQVRGDVQFVFRVIESCAQRVEVEIGQREAERMEIVKGLRAGDAIVVEGFQEMATAQPVIEVKPGEAEGENTDAGAASGDGQNGGQKPQGSEPDPERARQEALQAAERCKAVIAQADKAAQEQDAKRSGQ